MSVPGPACLAVRSTLFSVYGIVSATVVALAHPVPAVTVSCVAVRIFRVSSARSCLFSVFGLASAAFVALAPPALARASVSLRVPPVLATGTGLSPVVMTGLGTLTVLVYGYLALFRTGMKIPVPVFTSPFALHSYVLLQVR